LEIFFGVRFCSVALNIGRSSLAIGLLYKKTVRLYSSDQLGIEIWGRNRSINWESSNM